MKNLLPILTLFSLMFLLSACEEAEDLLPDNADPRDDFIGEWNCSETELKSTDDYTVTIQKDPDNSSQVLLQNFGLLGQDQYPYGLITGDRINVPQQEINGWTIKNASGDMNGENSIDWTYTLSNGSDDFQYAATYTRN